MAQLIVRNVDPTLVRALKLRAARRNRSAEAEHREILRTALLEETSPVDFKQHLMNIPHVGTDRDFARNRSRSRLIAFEE